MFKKILIANRGEIACRIIKTVQRLNIKAVAIFSSIDQHAKHVQMADAAYPIGHASAKDSYLNIETIISTALAAQVDAIHPGYGFLSENYEFALRCEQAGITFIGPPSSVIKQMGSKAAAKQTLADANVPLIPGYQGAAQDLVSLQQAATAIGYPLLIKASHGGGGKGMRLVTAASDFDSALASCQREAIAAFGNSEVILEKYLTHPRHIEVQIFADTFGNVVHLFERDCSIQRRHQKVIEEAPAHDLTSIIREKIWQTAVAAAKIINYRGAGTIEFLYEDNKFYFMEMNTRLQVEHPATEMITKLDLVEWQILISANRPLPLTQEQIVMSGHAIEARVCAEDPANDFLPSIGTIAKIVLLTPTAQHNHLETHYLTMADAQHGTELRIDSGIQAGDRITIYYDPLLAKVIVHADSRSNAIHKLQQVLNNFHILGLQTNLGFLRTLLKLPAYQRENIDTNFIANSNLLLPNELHNPDILHIALIAASILTLEQQQQPISSPLTTSPWAITSGWQLNQPACIKFAWLYKDNTHALQLIGDHKNCEILLAGKTWQPIIALEPINTISKRLLLTIHNQTYAIIGMPLANGYYISMPSHTTYHNLDYHFYLPSQEALLAHQQHGDNTLQAPMPGIISKILVTPGDLVAANDPLLILEAMKMEHTIRSPFAGTIATIPYNKGDIVEEGCILISIDPLPNTQVNNGAT